MLTYMNLLYVTPHYMKHRKFLKILDEKCGLIWWLIIKEHLTILKNEKIYTAKNS